MPPARPDRITEPHKILCTSSGTPQAGGRFQFVKLRDNLENSFGKAHLETVLPPSVSTSRRGGAACPPFRGMAPLGGARPLLGQAAPDGEVSDVNVHMGSGVLTSAAVMVNERPGDSTALPEAIHAQRDAACLLSQAQRIIRWASLYRPKTVTFRLCGCREPHPSHPVVVENSATVCDLQLQAVCWYSWIRPPRTVRRWIRAVGAGRAITQGSSFGARRPVPWP